MIWRRESFEWVIVGVSSRRVPKDGAIFILGFGWLAEKHTLIPPTRLGRRLEAAAPKSGKVKPGLAGMAGARYPSCRGESQICEFSACARACVARTAVKMMHQVVARGHDGARATRRGRS